MASEFKQDILSVIERAANGGEESNCALGGNKSRRTPAERVGNYEYYVLQTEDSPFPKYMRRPLRGWGLGSQKPEVVLDVNNLPSQHREIGTIKLSMCGRYVAFTATDSGLGEGTGTLMVRDITFSKHHTFRRLVQPVVDVEWAADGSLLATTVDALGRPSTVIRLHLSHSDSDSHGHDNHHSKQQGDVVIYHEPDPAYMVSLQRTKDWKYLGINAHSKLSSEIHILPALDPTLPNLRCLAPRKAGLEYVMEHHENRFYLLTNYDDDGESKRGDEGTSNYSLYYVDGASSSLGEWERVKLVLPPDIDRENLILEDMDVFKAAGLVLYGRDASKGGRPMVLVAQPHDVHLSSTSPTSSKHTPLVELHLSPLALPEWVRSVSSGANADYNAPLLRLFLSSPTHPDVAVDVDLLTVTGKKCKPSQIQIPVLVPKSFPFPVTTVSVPCLVHTDGAPEFKSIPVTYIGGNSDSGPCLVVVYAAYGHCLPTDFVPERIALLQRGWNIALVHARGGGELGRRWHAAGRGRNKGNSALDVIAAAEHLVRLGLARRGLLALEANSAGAIAAGGALLSSSSDLFGAAILESPFVDVLTAMSDPLLPLTIHEYDEFADPSDVSPHGGDLSADGLASIAAWCPYKNAKLHGKGTIFCELYLWFIGVYYIHNSCIF